MKKLGLQFDRKSSPVKFLFSIALTLYQDNCLFSGLRLFFIIGQAPITTADQPPFALAMRIQCAKSKTLGEDKLLVMMCHLPNRMGFMKCLGVILIVAFSYLSLKSSWSQRFKFL